MQNERELGRLKFVGLWMSGPKIFRVRRYNCIGHQGLRDTDQIKLSPYYMRSNLESLVHFHN